MGKVKVYSLRQSSRDQTPAGKENGSKSEPLQPSEQDGEAREETRKAVRGVMTQGLQPRSEFCFYDSDEKPPEGSEERGKL